MRRLIWLLVGLFFSTMRAMERLKVDIPLQEVISYTITRIISEGIDHQVKDDFWFQLRFIYYISNNKINAPYATKGRIIEKVAQRAYAILLHAASQPAPQQRTLLHEAQQLLLLFNSVRSEEFYNHLKTICTNKRSNVDIERLTEKMADAFSACKIPNEVGISKKYLPYLEQFLSARYTVEGCKTPQHKAEKIVKTFSKFVHKDIGRDILFAQLVSCAKYTQAMLSIMPPAAAQLQQEINNVGETQQECFEMLKQFYQTSPLQVVFDKASRGFKGYLVLNCRKIPALLSSNDAHEQLLMLSNYDYVVENALNAYKEFFKTTYYKNTSKNILQSLNQEIKKRSLYDLEHARSMVVEHNKPFSDLIVRTR